MAFLEKQIQIQDRRLIKKTDIKPAPLVNKYYDYYENYFIKQLLLVILHKKLSYILVWGGGVTPFLSEILCITL